MNEKEAMINLVKIFDEEGEEKAMEYFLKLLCGKIPIELTKERKLKNERESRC